MKKAIAIILVVCGLGAVASLTAAQEGMMCFKQKDCMPGYVCLKKHDYDPSGQCVKGGLP